MRFLICLILMACSVKRDEPELLLPPPDYDADQVIGDGFQLCIKTHPEKAEVLVSSRLTENCVQTKGETFVEVVADGYRPYRETLNVQGDLNHEVILLPLINEPSKAAFPMPTNTRDPAAFKLPENNISMCVSVVPSNAYLQVNGVKRTPGECVAVQNAAEVKVEAKGYVTHQELLSIPPSEPSCNRLQGLCSYEITITLEPTIEAQGGPF